MLLKYLQGVPQQEIAEELSVTPAYVSSTIKVFNKKCQTKLNS
jgi:DNA-directed RNA polymerase specialized sigma24 family protein